MKHQQIDPVKFIQDIEDVMDKKIMKKNTLVFHGRSNGGKSMIACSIVWAFKNVGMCTQGINYGFFLENCLHKRVILHGEPVIISQVQEIFKTLMEGGKTQVNRKGKESIEMERVPYIVTCNSYPWAGIPNYSDKEAFKNRCIIYDVKPTPAFQKYHGEIHPEAWRTIIDKADLGHYTIE